MVINRFQTKSNSIEKFPNRLKKNPNLLYWSVTNSCQPDTVAVND